MAEHRDARVSSEETMAGTPCLLELQDGSEEKTSWLQLIL
jgi:hypothetical protein